MPENTNSKKSYLFVLPWSLSSLGGVNQVVENLYCQMKMADRYDPVIMVNSWSDRRIRKQDINGIDHFFLRLRSPWDDVKKISNAIAFIPDFFWTTFNLYKFIKSKKVDVINVHYCSLYALNFTLMKYLGIFKGKLLLSFHGKDLFLCKKSKGIKFILWKILFHSSDKIITCSESLKKEFVKIYKPGLQKTAAVHNGIDISKIFKHQNLHLDDLFKNKKFILNVGTLENKKGQDVLLKAFEKISQDFKDIYLIIIGRPGGAEKQVRQIINAYGLSQRVYLYEGLSHDQVVAFMEKAMIFVLPSRFEPFGIVILEAGAFGVPVIASNVGGIREIISHDKTGRLCEPDDINCLAKELGDLLTDSDERERLGRNLQKHILENFSWERAYQKYIDNIGL